MNVVLASGASNFVETTVNELLVGCVFELDLTISMSPLNNYISVIWVFDALGVSF